MDLAGKARELWGERLAPIDPNLLKLDLPDPVRDFLVTAGLPGVPLEDFAFYHDRRLRPAERLGRPYLVVGHVGAPLVVDRRTGEVGEFSWRETHPPRFLNSSLPAFLIFLARFLAGRDAIYADRGVSARVAGELAAEFRVCDPAALAGPDTGWSATLREVGDGRA